jgi:hypothetical protein
VAKPEEIDVVQYGVQLCDQIGRGQVDFLKDYFYLGEE